MAILKTSAGGGDFRSFKLDTLAPKGTFAATCVDCMEHMGIERKKYKSEETEVVDVLRYLFVIDSKDGPFLVQTGEMKMSAYKEATLAKFIQSWTGEMPGAGFDTLDLVGECCQLTINHKTSERGTTYPVITSISPLLDDSMAPDANALEIPGGSRSGIEVKSGNGKAETPASDDDNEDSPF